MAGLFTPYVHSPGMAKPIAPNRGYFLLNPLHRNPSITGVHPAPSGTVPTPHSSELQYPEYTDPYGSLLTNLASMRDLALSGLKTDLEGRIGSITGLVNASRAPLNSNYSTAIQEAAAVNDSVANRLSAQGTGGTEDLRSKLASLGQDPSAAVGDLSNYYSGLGGANYAMDSGDVQRLIGRQAEENTLLNKQPTLIAQQLNQDYATNTGNVINDYLSKAVDLQTQQAADRSAYNKDKFDFQQSQAAAKLAQQNTDLQTYNDNYWKNQDYLFRKWQTQIASGDKKAANQTRQQIAAAQRKAQIDIANIRAGATKDAADTRSNTPKPYKNTTINGHAATYDPNSGTYYYPGTKKPVPQSVLDTWSKKNPSGTGNKDNWQTPGSAKQTRVAASINKALYTGPGLRTLRNYATDDGIRHAVKAALRSEGIDPNSAAGKKFVEQQLRAAGGKVMANGARYVYAPPHPGMKTRPNSQSRKPGTR